MNTKLENKLKKRFKFIPKYSALCSKQNIPFSIDCGDGWYDIIYETCEKIEKVLEKEEQDPEYPFIFHQIKEKFSQIRIYCSWETDKISNIITEAENKSGITCEVCGKCGELYTTGYWLMTLCDKCAENRKAEKYKSEKK